MKENNLTAKDEIPAWFVGRTRFGQELKARDMLLGFGVEHFIPVRQRKVTRCGRTRVVEAPLINNLVFIKSTKTLACSLANYNGLPVKYIVDRNTRTMMEVPPRQMEDFIRVVNDGGPDVDRDFSVVLEVGDRVRVARGPLEGVEGNVIESGEHTYIAVTLGGVTQVRAEIPAGHLEKI